jgi:glycosyltransferase involved in cell wall biosynthesis
MLSVLICTYNRPQLLAQCLEALICRTIEKPDEVVVVNGGDGRTDRLVESFITASPDGIKINLVKTVNKNLASSRNIGLPHCRGDIIAMTDDDAEVFPNWVTLMKQAHQEHPEAGAIGGPVLGTNTESLVGKVADLMTFPSWKEPQYVRTLPGVNISYKQQMVEKVGLQDETLFRGEDVDYN